MEVRKGSPSNRKGRLERENRVYEWLDTLQIDYESIDHHRADTLEACRSVESVLKVSICKNLFLCNRQKTNFYLLMMPGEKLFKTKELSAQIQSSRLSFADEEAMLEFLDIQPGAVSILGLINDTKKRVSLLVDEDLLKQDFIGCHPCVCTSTLKIKKEDLFGKYLESTHHTMQVVHLEGK
ncbi:MAG TPA: prolyl-tRNA synthetase associated domain-containing protein [Lachnospiraceae bacterium]